MTEEDYYDEYDFHDDPDDPEYYNHLPGEIEITNDNYEDMVRRFMLGVRQTHMGVHRDTQIDQDFEINQDHDTETENSLNGAGYDDQDSFVSHNDDVLDPSSEEEKGADLSKLKETSYKIQENKEDQAKVEKANCAICMEDIVQGNKVIELSCSHMFHAPCIFKWVKDKNSCPYCRKPVTT